MSHALLAALLASVYAGAFDLNASIVAHAGLGYSNLVLSAPGDLGARVSHGFLQDYSLSLGTAPLPNGDLNARLMLKYSNLLGARTDGEFSLENFGFAAEVQAMKGRMIPLFVSARREQVDTGDKQLEREFLGNTILTTLQGQARLNRKGFPLVRLTAQSAWQETANSFGEASDTNRLIGSAQISQNVHHLHYDATGQITHSQGSLAGAAFTSQSLTLSSTSNLTENVRFSGRTALFRRQAGVEEAGNPNSGSSNVNLNVFATHSPRLRSTYVYGYGQSSLDDPGSVMVQASSHAANANLIYEIDENWQVGGGANLTYLRQSRDGSGGDAVSESGLVDASFRFRLESWSGNVRVGLRGGGTHPDDGPANANYGVLGQVGVNTKALTHTTFGLNLSGSGGQDLALATDTLEMRAALHATTTAIARTRLSAIADGTYQERRNVVLGDSRFVQGAIRLSGLFGRMVQVQLNGRYRDGTSQFLINPNDPLQLPEDYNVVTASASAALTLNLIRNLSVQTTGAITRLQTPDRVQERDYVELRATYRFGKLAFSVWDRVSLEGSGGARVVSNTLFAIISRDFAFTIQ